MSRFGSEEVAGVLTGSYDPVWAADLYYAGDRRQANIPLSDVSFSEDADAEIQQSGSCTVTWSDEFATSLTPTEITDPLAPFGAQLQVFSVIRVGSFEERIQYGWFEIADVPDARDETMRFRGEWITTGSTVQLDLRELLYGPSKETFDAPKAPDSLLSVWDEVGRISGLPLSRTVADAPIPRSVMHPEKKLEAITNLLDIVLDAAPHMTADGALSARPNAWPAPVAELTRARELVDVGSMMSAEDVYNRVVVRAVNDDAEGVLYVAEVTKGPLRVRNPDGSVSPFRARTLYLKNELVNTEALARAWAISTLAQVSTPRAQILPVTEVFNPLRERGDVVTIERPNRTLLGRVATINRGMSRTQELTVEIAGEA